MTEYTFSAACEYLGLAPSELTSLRDSGLLSCTIKSGKQIYSRISLDIAKHLLMLGQQRQWSWETLAWYVDLTFATQVGRAILANLESEEAQTSTLPTSWIETQYATSVLKDLTGDVEHPDGALVGLLRSLIAIGQEQFWTEPGSLETSALYPIVTYFEEQGIPVIGQGDQIARDVGSTFALMMYAFTTIAPPISTELTDLTHATHTRLKGSHTLQINVPSEEQNFISEEGLIAVDKLYASKAPEIHTPPETWEYRLGVISTDKRSITLQWSVLEEGEKISVDNIIDLIRPYVGPYGARVVHLLYQIANDPPYWRNPLVTIDTNEFLDRLGIKRDPRGVHYSRNRERLRNTLNAAHNLEVVGEFMFWEGGKQTRQALRRSVISLIGATYDAEETHNLSTEDLFQQGLPKTMQIRLNFYSGVRRLDGRLGSQYVLMPRLANPKALAKANYAATEELLRSYLLYRYRQTHTENRTNRSLNVTRGTALAKAGITTKNITRATQILTRALNKLVEQGTIEHYSAIPLKPHESFTVELTNEAVKHSLGDSE